MTSHRLRPLLYELAENGIPESYDCWPSIRQRLTDRQPTSIRTKVRWQLAAVALVTLAVLGLSAAFLATSMPESVSAQELVDRASAVSDGLGTAVHSYHISATNTLRSAEATPAPAVQNVETWVGGPGRIRQDTRTPEWSTMTVTNGEQAWWQVSRNGHTYVAPANGIRFSDMAYLNPLVPEGTNMARVLAFLAQHGCGTFRLQPDQTVAGRDAYVVSATHTLGSMLQGESGCGNPIQLLSAPSPAARPSGAGKVAPAPSPSAAVAQLSKPVNQDQASEVQRLLSTTVTDTFWIDRQTFVPLKAEQNLGPKGTSHYEVTSVQFDVAIPESLFQFTPPANAEMLPNPAALKQALAGR